jgi:AcrR family transcriptional regulator
MRRYGELSQQSRPGRPPTTLERHLAGDGDRRQVTPTDVLRAARRRFLRGQRVDMNELARELGIGRATLYRWVGSRDQLIGEVLWSLAEQGLARARAEAAGRGADRVLAVYRRFGDFIVELAPLRRFVQAEPECALRVMTSKASPVQRRVVGTFRDLLAEERDRGLPLRFAPETLAFVLVRIAESFLWSDLITGEAPDLAKAEEITAVLLA